MLTASSADTFRAHLLVHALSFTGHPICPASGMPERVGLSDVVHHRERLPLRVRLSSASQRESVESERRAQIRKRRRGDAEPELRLAPALLAVNLVAHLLHEFLLAGRGPAGPCPRCDSAPRTAKGRIRARSRTTACSQTSPAAPGGRNAPESTSTARGRSACTVPPPPPGEMNETPVIGSASILQFKLRANLLLQAQRRCSAALEADGALPQGREPAGSSVSCNDWLCRMRFGPRFSVVDVTLSTWPSGGLKSRTIFLHPRLHLFFATT